MQHLQGQQINYQTSKKVFLHWGRLQVCVNEDVILSISDICIKVFALLHFWCISIFHHVLKGFIKHVVLQYASTVHLQ